ncbi:MAG: histidinol-phosphate aminotransferase, partial [Lautropia sp.]
MLRQALRSLSGSVNVKIAVLGAGAWGTAVAARMRESGVLIKDVGRMHPMLHNCLRLTVGTPEENRQMLLALR